MRIRFYFSGPVVHDGTELMEQRSEMSSKGCQFTATVVLRHESVLLS